MAEFLIRHGESQANVDGLFAGLRNNSPLTELGEKQAHEAAEKLEAYNITKIISSPLKRALDTAKIISKDLGGLRVIADGRLAEFDLGELMGTPIRTVPAELLLSTPGTEDPKEFATRVCESLLDHAHDAGNTLYVSHGGTRKIIDTLLAGNDLASFCMLESRPNTEVYKVDTQRIREAHRWVLKGSSERVYDD